MSTATVPGGPASGGTTSGTAGEGAVPAGKAPGEAASRGATRGGAPSRGAHPASPATVVARIFALICVCVLFFIFNLVVVSQVREYFSQNGLYGELRLTLAEGATPIGPLTNRDLPVANGTPVAVMNAPSVGLTRAVIVQGSGAAQTMAGIGHVPDTVMPCQAGVAALMARSGAYGGYRTGGAWARMVPGDQFTVAMGQGSCTYEVTDQRRAGQLAPAAPTGNAGSIVLITATGSAFMPTGVLRIDAKLVTKSFAPPAATIPASDVPAAENPMAADTSQLFELVLLLQVLLVAAGAAAWAWYRWGKWQTWVAAAPILLAFGVLACDNINLLLPNLL